MKKLVALLVMAGLAASVAVYAADATYVGSNKCKMCHMKEYKAWADTKHAKALHGLKDADEKAITAMNAILKTEVKANPEKADACVGCHVTGFKAGGYPAADSLMNAALSGVTCEACHGAGSLHVKAPKAEKKAAIHMAVADDCKKCHTAAISPKFDFATMSKKVHAVAVAAPAK